MELIRASGAGGSSAMGDTAHGGEPEGATTPPPERSMHDCDVASFLRDSANAIWGRKMLGRILDLYAPHALIHVGTETTLHGSDQLLDRAVQCLAAFPDLQLFLDDLLAVRRDGTYLTSVRWTAVAHNTGPSAYGPATGHRVVVPGITNALIKSGRVVEQWIELGDGDLVRQLGFEERSVLQRLWPPDASFEEMLDRGVSGRDPDDRLSENSPPPAVGALLEAALDTIWNRRQIGEVDRFFAPQYRERGPGRRELFGRQELQTAIISLLGALPDLRMYVDDVFWDGDLQGGARSSTRWTLLGTNTGPSAYGPPTNGSLRLSGITNHRLEEGQVVEGWTAYSQLGLAQRLAGGARRMQIEDAE